MRKTLLNEFYRVAFRIAELQAALVWIGGCNEAKPHQGGGCSGKTPMQTLRDAIPIATEKMNAA